MGEGDSEIEKPQIDINIELAKRRTRDASERTLMAWIRTTLSMISFGFGVDKITEAILKTQLKPSPHLTVEVRIFGFGLIVLGVIGLIFALFEYSTEIKNIEEAKYEYRPALPYTLIIGWGIALIGIFSLLTILFRSLF